MVTEDVYTHWILIEDRQAAQTAANELTAMSYTAVVCPPTDIELWWLVLAARPVRTSRETGIDREQAAGQHADIEAVAGRHDGIYDNYFAVRWSDGQSVLDILDGLAAGWHGQRQQLRLL